MTSPLVCPECGAELPADAPSGMCPRCLLRLGLESDSGDAAVQEGSSASSTTTAASGFVPPAPEELAKRFPQLAILELVGAGGMGAVYKARQVALDRLVAVKILPPEIGSDPAFAERFAREARALARLNHQNIVAVYDSGQVEGLYYFVMEYVDGVNLRQLMEAGDLRPEQALLLVPQICEALQFAHDQGVVHRDIKPENILVDRQSRVKIADFGLAKLLTATPASRMLTLDRQVMGTWHYMAPEQMRGAAAVDHRADIYSLGVVFYELLTGHLPMGHFERPSQAAAVDARLDEIVLRALAREPSARYQRASEVKTDVDSVATGPRPSESGEAAAQAAASSPPAQAFPPPPVRPHPEGGWAGGVAAAVGSPDEALRQKVRAQVQAPAVALIVLAGLTLAATILPVAFVFLFRLLGIRA